MNLGIAGQAAGLFAVTNVDDLVVLALFFARGAGRRGAGRRVVAGQYLGFAAILAVAAAAAFGATFLPEPVLPYLGLLPLALGPADADGVGDGLAQAVPGGDLEVGDGGPV
ncbi:cadmium resistance transporter, partial [Nonomuraea pusilla]